MQKKWKSALSQSFKIGISLALIFWLIRSGRLEFRSLTLLLQPLYLIPGILCVGLSLAIGTERWRLFLKSQQIQLPYYQALQLTLIGLFFNFAMPGGVGGDLVKGYYITRHSKNSRVAAALTVLLDRLIGLLAMSLIALMMMFAKWDLMRSSPQLSALFLMICTVTAGSLLLWSFIFSKRLYDLGWVEKILALLPKSHVFLKTYRSLTQYRHSKKVFFSTLLMSFAAQLVSVLFFVFAGHGLGYSEIPASTYFVIVPVAFMVQSLPLSPGGVGLGQAAAFFLFNLVEPNSGQLGSASTTAYQIAQFAFGLIGACFYVGISKQMKRPEPLPSPSEELS